MKPIKLFFTPKEGSPLYEKAFPSWPIKAGKALAAELTTNHASSYGQTMLVIAGKAYGQAEISGHLSGGTSREDGLAGHGFLDGEHGQVVRWVGQSGKITIGSDVRPDAVCS